MNKRTLLLPALAIATFCAAQDDPYFPPITGEAWETMDPASLGWCTDQMPALLDFLEESNTKAFIVLKDGRIVIEHYFGTFTADSSWYWASAGKSLTAFLVGLAQEDGLLDIDDATSEYLGTGWTSCTPEQEAAITVRHQLTMTTGLDDGTSDLDCTDPACLQYLAAPGTRWSYHNAPYTLLDGVLEEATGQNLNLYLYNNLTTATGITGLYIPVGDNNVFFSKPRSMARFGLLAQHHGVWTDIPVLGDAAYFTAMTTPSQDLNPAYGYLWWLNGQSEFMLPGPQFVFPGTLMPDAPQDAYNAMGKNGQVINVSPVEGLVVVRMGDLPGGIFVPNVYNNQIWQHLNAVICSSTGIDAPATTQGITLHPNPATDALNISLPAGTIAGELRIVDAMGRVVSTKQVRSTTERMDLCDLAPGSYRCVLTTGNGRAVKGFVK
ncbi:MAG TPA: serine hydrolase, partial [Flavobacteriales bacterium]